MNILDRYRKVFSSSERIGRFYIDPGSDVHGDTLRIYVLGENEDDYKDALLNGRAVLVFGYVFGKRERYDWLKIGPWMDDFEAIWKERNAALKKQKVNREQLQHEILDNYVSTRRSKHEIA